MRKQVLLLIFVLSSALSSPGMIIDGYSSSTNDRFAKDNAFIAAAFDLSGVAISQDGRWATLLSPNVFITANHYPPGVGQSITFYRTNDPSGPKITRSVSTVRQRIGTSDLLLCTLNLPVPEGYAFYSFFDRSTLSTRGWQLLGGKEVYHFGKSPGNSFSSPLNLAVGKNVIDGRVSNQVVESPAANGPAILCAQNTDLGKIPFETMAQIGDSGGPLFIDTGNNSLQLAGIAWFITSAPSTGFSPTGDHAADINSFLGTHSLPYQPQAPGSFAGSRLDANQISLSWQDLSAVESEYFLERAEDPEGPWTALPLVPADATAYLDNSAPSGDVYYRLQARNQTASDSVLCSVLTPYSLWAAGIDWGGLDASPTGDASGDGLENLVSYAFALDPLQPAPAASLPSLQSPAETLDYSYRQNAAAADIQFELQYSGSLQAPDWQTVLIDGESITQEDLGADGPARLMLIRMPAGDFPDPVFFRLEISTSDPP
ncbi:MAG: hypothetical protein ACO3N7_05585 [Kiritimatiellia bacterium]